jgi:histidyl-tRNA synthetase
MQALIADAPKLVEDVDPAAAAHFERVQAALRTAGVPFVLNPRLVRGLDYYNRTVFEWTTTLLGAQGTVCAGGRYDGLMAQIGGKPMPACGYAMGVERLLELLAAARRIEPAAPDAYVLRQGEAAEPYAERIAEELRDAGLAVILHCGGGSFKSQMRKADSSRARFAVIIGDEEVAAEAVTLKPLREAAEQVRVSPGEAADRMRRST